ncbi:hypothetical protein CASFOL_002408 [Castilleja foliolosa]|uniref:PGG domain-containing protein n=1 Tax=Castilleja foliolosa TaxID=1961234 RepID=A0ABD3EEF2_9LAMI
MSDEQKIKEMNSYAKTGDTKSLYLLIKQDPYILKKIDEIPFVHTPLHEAAGQGQTSFAIEIMSLLPSLGKKLDPDGFSPLHIALKERKKETVLALVKFDKSLVRVKGFEGFTPLHYAAKYYPDLDILSCFLIDCQESIEDLNNRFQNAVHLVMESGDDEAIDLVLKWLVRTARETVLGWQDDNLNTALHVAARYGCLQAVKIMVKIAKLNKRNSDNNTPLDIAKLYKNDQVTQILIKAHAKTSQQLTPKQTDADYLRSETNILEKAVRGYCFVLKDLTVGMRSVVLVVAVLITTATYQAVLQPPGGVFPADTNSGNTTANATRISARRVLVTAAAAPASSLPPRGLDLPKVGKMVMREADYIQFMPANTVAFTLSMVIIIFVLHGRPYNVILHGCLIFLAYSYLVAMESISESGNVCQIMFILSWNFLSAAFVLKMMYYVVKALFEDVWWLRSGGVTWHNMSYLVERPVLRKVMSFARQLRRQSKLIQRLK